uniref:Uncharacterized protein n=1 Tax=Ascaris lumbricoides TaxID=6252 RepID=A0A0M3HIQ0_ASCLU
MPFHHPLYTFAFVHMFRYHTLLSIHSTETIDPNMGRLNLDKNDIPYQHRYKMLLVEDIYVSWNSHFLCPYFGIMFAGNISE